jgi:hypothetical protein
VFGNVSNRAQVDEDRVGLTIDELPDLRGGILSSRNGTENKGVVEGNHESTAVGPKDTAQANSFSVVAQAASMVKRYNRAESRPSAPRCQLSCARALPGA